MTDRGLIAYDADEGQERTSKTGPHAQPARYWTSPKTRGSSDVHQPSHWNHRAAVLEGKYAHHRDAGGNPINDHAGSAAFRCTTPANAGTDLPAKVECWLMPNMPYAVWRAIAADRSRFRRYDSFRPYGREATFLPNGYLRVSMVLTTSPDFDCFPSPHAADFTI